MKTAQQIIDYINSDCDTCELQTIVLKALHEYAWQVAEAVKDKAIEICEQTDYDPGRLINEIDVSQFIK